MTIRKAITFRASSIGDCLMAKYLLDNIHAQYPEARLGIVVASHGAMIRDLLSSTTYIEVIEANRRHPGALWELWKKFHGSDMVVTQYAGKHGGRFGLGSKLAARVLARRGGLVGFMDPSKWNEWLYNKLLLVRPDQAVAEHERDVLRAAGIPITIPYPTLEELTDRDIPDRFELVPPYIVAHFFAGNIRRGINPDRARELLQELRKNLPDMNFVISGSAADRAVAELIAKDVSRTIVIAGRASLQDMMQIVVMSCGVISIDTGIAHIAAQLRSPLIVIRTCLGPNWWFLGQYGSGAPRAQFSREDLCVPHVTKDYPDCVNALDMAMIAERGARLFTS